MSVTVGDKCPFYCTVKNWVARFRTGHWSTEDEEHSERPTQATIPEYVDAIHSMVLDDRRVSTKNIAETLAIRIPRNSRLYYSRDFVHEKALSQMGSQMSQCCQKRDRLLVSQAILDRFRLDPVGFFNRLVSMDETWIHIHDPETKERSKAWRHSDSLSPKKFKTQKSSSKMLASVFWDKARILFVDYLEKAATIAAKYVGKLKQRLVSKRRGKLRMESCFFKVMVLLTRRPLRTRNWEIFSLKF
jgi:hypothetical protein